MLQKDSSMLGTPFSTKLLLYLVVEHENCKVLIEAHWGINHAAPCPLYEHFGERREPELTVNGRIPRMG